MIPIAPKNSPPFLNANGIAMIPVPRDPFTRWIRVPKFLKYVESYLTENIRRRCLLSTHELGFLISLLRKGS